MTNIAIFASHNGSGFEALYEASKNNILDINISLIISSNSSAGILTKAKNLNINNHIVNTDICEDVDAQLTKLLKSNNCEYIFLSGYMKKVSPIITNNFKVINSHPSLLPSYGGAGMYGKYVHEAVIKNNEKISGVTIHEVNENYDEGKIIFQQSLNIIPTDTAIILEQKIKALEKVAIVEGFKLCLK
ncbi:MAG TPA: phosphoribosylglycinamide formyltransferase [Arcobacter sp.]|nr:phosphoribosylglycinamide formyltransferase [Arcobacter sp.]HIP55527.1 phosphoribosylglycinamide formyltransferase [Arcobacter sp.]